jgi:hypothetical protein
LKKFLLSILISLILLFSISAPVLAATEGSVTGEFGISAPPTVEAVSLISTSLTPQTEYTVTGIVGDPDKISNFGQVVCKVWYDADGGAATEADFDAATANPQTCAVITWAHTSGTSSTTVLTPTTGGSTWSLISSAVPTTSGHYTGTSFNFSFTFKVGKVATETSGAGKWQVAMKVTDVTDQSAFAVDGEGASMNWYGDISVPSTTVDWGGLSRGVDFGGTGSQKSLGAAITYRANGSYDEKVKSSTTWIGDIGNAILDSTGTCDDNNEFSLKADDATIIDSAVFVDDVGITIDDTGTQTSESGDSVSNNNIWIKLSSLFDSDNYQGTISYVISNGLD